VRNEERQPVEKSVGDFVNLMGSTDFLGNLVTLQNDAKRDYLSGTLDMRVFKALSELLKSTRLKKSDGMLDELSFVIESYRKAVLAGDRDGYLIRLRTLANDNLIFPEVFSCLMTLISDHKTVTEQKNFTAPVSSTLSDGCGGGSRGFLRGVC